MKHTAYIFQTWINWLNRWEDAKILNGKQDAIDYMKNFLELHKKKTGCYRIIKRDVTIKETVL